MFFLWFYASHRLLDVCHGQRTEREREGQLVLFLVFEHLEQDLSGYIASLPSTGMPTKTIQVWFYIFFFLYLFLLRKLLQNRLQIN